MKKRHVLLFILTVSLFNILHSVEIGLEGGVSTFNYSEVGINNKDDLYNIKSSIVGLTFRNSLSTFDLKTSMRAQVPFDLTFTDALGTDDTNYLNTLLYFGGNFQLSVLYNLYQNQHTNLSLGPLVNYDYFYFEDFIVGLDDKYIFSILGIGLSMNYLYLLKGNLFFDINGSWNYNFLEIGERVGTLKWSNNLIISSGLVYRF